MKSMVSTGMCGVCKILKTYKWQIHTHETKMMKIPIMSCNVQQYLYMESGNTMATRMDEIRTCGGKHDRSNIRKSTSMMVTKIVFNHTYLQATRRQCTLLQDCI